MDIVIERVRKEPLSKIKCGDSIRGDERYHLLLSLIDRAYVTMKYLVEVRYRFAVSAIEQRRPDLAKAREADEIFGKRMKAF